MSFTSFGFVFFFLAVLLLRSCVRTGAGQKWVLLAASICFYLTWSVPCVLLILFTCVMDYSIGKKLGETAEPAARKRLLVVSLISNLGMLGFFKYTNFLLENLGATLNALGWRVGPLHCDIPLPPAISYFTFGSLSYVLDVYYERCPPCGKLRDYALFVTFFPKVLSGPIARARDFLPQLERRAQVTVEDLEIGMARFLEGAVKKMVIADQIASHVNLIFSAPAQYDGFTLLQGLLGYVAQLYCDFAGYSDMAIGCARILGFRIQENFQMPFSSTSITEFWRRWHISFSTWLRDYIFLPLEMATRDRRSALGRVAVNLMITFLLCGLWHGASWNFVVWGGIMGAALTVHVAWKAWDPLSSLKQSPVFARVWTVCSLLLTLGFFALAETVFRAQTLGDSLLYLGRMLSWNRDGISLGSPFILPALLALVITHLVIGKDRIWSEEIVRRGVPARLLAYSGLVTLLAFLGATDGPAFIYFRF